MTSVPEDNDGSSPPDTPKLINPVQSAVAAASANA